MGALQNRDSEPLPCPSPLTPLPPGLPPEVVVSAPPRRQEGGRGWGPLPLLDLFASATSIPSCIPPCLPWTPEERKEDLSPLGRLLLSTLVSSQVALGLRPCLPPGLTASPTPVSAACAAGHIFSVCGSLVYCLLLPRCVFLSVSSLHLSACLFPTHFWGLINTSCSPSVNTSPHLSPFPPLLPSPRRSLFCIFPSPSTRLSRRLSPLVQDGPTERTRSPRPPPHPHPPSGTHIFSPGTFSPSLSLPPPGLCLCKSQGRGEHLPGLRPPLPVPVGEWG